MKIIILILFFLLMSCGKKEANSVILPSNQASDSESMIINNALNTIQKDFDDVGVNINVKSIPYHVSTLENSLAGYCMYDEDHSPVGIVINHRVFSDWEIETPASYGLIYKVLLHEIGHCFFNRQHENDYFSIQGFWLALKGEDDVLHKEESLELSVMKVGGKGHIPKSLWPYYIKEVAGLDRLSTLSDLERYVDVELTTL